MDQIQAKCHCGNVMISVKSLPDTVTSCNCSICRRYATLWAYYKPEEVKLECKDGATTPYIWGDRELEFHRCTNCGCVTHYVTIEPTDDRIFAINARMIDLALIEPLRVRYADNAS